jgi:hypothetical protein
MSVLGVLYLVMYAVNSTKTARQVSALKKS